MSDIFEEMKKFEREMEELIDGFLHSRRSIGLGRAWKPSVNVIGTDENLIVLVEASGVKAEEIKISLDENYLMIKGRRVDPFYSENCNFYAIEIDFGEFERTIRLPTMVETEKVEITDENGFVKIVLPLKKIIEKKIEIE